MNAREGGPVAGERWLLLIHQIPPKPDYLRVKIGRRLQQVGALAVKNSVYVLPDRETSFEDFQWIRTEIVDGGGDASICRADFVDGLTTEQLRHLFRAARNADFAEVAAAAQAIHRPSSSRARGVARTRRGRGAEGVARLRKRLAAIVAIDFFEATERAMAEEALRLLEAELTPRGVAPSSTDSALGDPTAYRGRTWVTRSGVFVDRMASAWLIRRSIDPEARFKFVEATRYRPGKGELRFDMFEGEFTHEGDRCTFETLMHRFAINDPGLHALAEIVHDIDLRDEKFGRDDAAGIERVLAGIVATYPEDTARLERGFQLFDELYALFAADSERAASGAASKR